MQAHESREHSIPPMEVCHSMVTHVPLFMRIRIVHLELDEELVDGMSNAGNQMRT
jgi:hypothetical protein